MASRGRAKGALPDRLCHHAGGRRNDAAAERLAEKQHIRLNGGEVCREPLPGAGESGLNFVDDQKASRIAAHLGTFGQIIIAGDLDAALALDRFNNKCGRLERFARFFQCTNITKGYLSGVTCQRWEMSAMPGIVTNSFLRRLWRHYYRIAPGREWP